MSGRQKMRQGNFSTSPVVLRVRVTPRGGGNQVIGYRPGDETLLLRVQAPPVDGAANRACLELIANIFALRRAQVTLIGGATSREKRFALAGITDTALHNALLKLKRCEQELEGRP